MTDITATYTDSLEVQFGALVPGEGNTHAFTAQGIDVLDSADLNAQSLGLPAGFSFVAEYQISGDHAFSPQGTPTVAMPTAGSIQVLAVQGTPAVGFAADGTPELSGVTSSFAVATGTLLTPQSMLQVGPDGSVSGSLDWSLQGAAGGAALDSIVIHPASTVTALNAATLDLSDGQGAATLVLGS